MGKNKKVVAATCGPQMSVTLRQASTGKKHTNVKSLLKLQHLKNLAIWATQDAVIPSLGAFFGHHFAASSEALAAPVDPSLLTCQRCESILQPGYNCTIRIEKNKKNARHKGKKATNYPQNNIVYTCNFCSHRNMKRGTPRNTSQPKVKPHPKSTKRKTGKTKDNTLSTDIAASLGPTTDELDKGKMGILEINETLKVKDDSVDINTIVAPVGSTSDDPKGKTGNLEIMQTLEVKNDSAASVPVTPLTKSTLTLLELKMKKRNRSGAKKKVAHENSLEASNAEKSSKKRRRKSWTSLKEIAERDDDDNRNKRLMNLTVPFSSFDV